MNCKPGDLACVVRLPECAADLRAALQEQLLGRVVRCVEVAPDLVWAIAEPVVIRMPWLAGFAFVLAGIEDAILQPIRGVPVSEDQRDQVTA